MARNKKYNEGEMGSGDSDDEFFNVKLPYTSGVEKPPKKIEVKKVYSPPRTKVQYDYKFDSSSDDESENSKNPKSKNSKECSSEKLAEKNEPPKENSSLSQNTFKVVEKINEQLKNMKNTGAKANSEKTESSSQNHITTTSAVNVSQHQVGVLPSVMVVPPPMVVSQPPVMNMGPMIVPSPLGITGQNLMTMMPSQGMMGVAGSMIRGPNPMGGLMATTNSISNGMIGVNAMPGVMGMQGNIVAMQGHGNVMGLQGGVINSTPMGGNYMAIQGGMMRMAGTGNNLMRMQSPGGNLLSMQGANNMMGITRPNANMIGLARPMNISGPPGNIPGGMVISPGNVGNNTGGMMVMGGMLGKPNIIGVHQTNLLNTGNNIVKGNPPVRAIPPQIFRGKSPGPGNLRWDTNQRIQASVPKVGSPTASRPLSSPSASSPTSSPLDRGKDYDGDEIRDDKDKALDKSPTADTDESQSPPPPLREMPNTFKNDGSFMEMFKKMREENNKEAKTSSEKSGHSEVSESSSTIKKPTVMITGIVGKRRGGRVLKTGLVKKVKKENDTDEEKNPKDAWSMYMAEVKKYREASCEEEGKTRPLVK